MRYELAMLLVLAVPAAGGEPPSGGGGRVDIEGGSLVLHADRFCDTAREIAESEPCLEPGDCRAYEEWRRAMGRPESLLARPDAGPSPAPEAEWVGERISLSLRDADLVEVLRSFAKMSRLNVVLQPGVTGKVSLELRDVPWDQALAAVLKSHSLGVEVYGPVARIAPLDLLASRAVREAEALRAPWPPSWPVRPCLVR